MTDEHDPDGWLSMVMGLQLALDRLDAVLEPQPGDTEGPSGIIGEDPMLDALVGLHHLRDRLRALLAAAGADPAAGDGQAMGTELGLEAAPRESLLR